VFLIRIKKKPHNPPIMIKRAIGKNLLGGEVSFIEPAIKQTHRER
jgi:hypothetical protein